jgi:predicted aldo/keto reductase-like oxidoreductase
MNNSHSNKLEQSGVRLSTLGLGVEHFVRGVRKVKHLSRDENSKLILEEAYKQGMTHYDLVFDFPYFFDVFKEFSKDKREKITFTTHIGNIYDEKTGKAGRTRSINKIRNSFDRIMDEIDTDYTDIALIQFVTNLEDYTKVVENGIIEFVKNLKQEGRAKSIGVSAHNPDLLLKMIENDEFDVVMFPLNFATGVLTTTKKLIEVCKEKNLALIAIKNLHKGKLFTTRKTDLAAYYSGGRRISLQLDQPATPAQCFNYALDLGIDSVVFGVKTVEELKENILSYETEQDVDYSYLVKKFNEIVNSSK